MELYKIVDGYRKLLDIIDNHDNELQTPENNIDAMLKDALDSVEDDFNNKVENIIKLIRSLEMTATAIKAEEDRFYKRRKTLENSISFFKFYIKNSMEALGKQKVETLTGVASIRKSPAKLVVLDLLKIPDKWLKIKKEPDITAIKDAMLENGEVIDGVELQQNNTTLTIK